MKTLDKLPSTVRKPCGTKPGPENDRFVRSLNLEACRNWASYVVKVDGIEILVCGSHRKAIQEPSGKLFEEVLREERND